MTLSVDRLGARYGRIEVCRDISFSAGAGEFLVVLGPNGAGKSSLLGALAGCVASGGAFEIDGRALHGLPARTRSKRGIALVPEGRRNLFPPLSVHENLALGLRLLPAAERAGMHDSLLTLFPVLAQRSDQLAGLLSGGEQQMLAIAVAIARRPSVLLLDEPSQGLAPVVLEQLVDAIGRLRSFGMTLLLAEQNHRFAAQLADRYLVLQGGELAGGGTAAELRDSNKVAAALMVH